MKIKIRKNNYDSPWKDILDIFLQDFLELCCPDIAQDVDWDKGYAFLDKELQAIAKEAVFGLRIVDKLVKIWLKTGNEIWVLLHVEVQGQRIKEFELRTMICHQRIFEKYRKPVVSLVILTDRETNWRPQRYSESLWGCSLDFKFRIVKLLDYKSCAEELAKSNNPFALVILAHLAALEKYPNAEARLSAKVTIVKKLYKHGWDKQKILDLYSFIDWVIALPQELIQEYSKEIEQIKEIKQMRYVTTLERYGIEKGLQQGRQEGEQTLLLCQIKQKFGSIPKHYLQKIKQADAELLLKWGQHILAAEKLEDVFQDD